VRRTQGLGSLRLYVADAVVDLDRLGALDIPAQDHGGSRVDLFRRCLELLNGEAVGAREIVDDATAEGGQAENHRHDGRLRAIADLPHSTYQKNLIKIGG
jgi:hypothetical protein